MTGWRLALRVAGLGWYVALCITLGLLAGLWLDGRFDTTPTFFIVGTLLGVVTAFWGMYRMVAPMMSDPPANGGNGAGGSTG